eukprot:357461-Chlamydomonas_euryale.AAC.5
MSKIGRIGGGAPRDADCAARARPRGGLRHGATVDMRQRLGRRGAARPQFAWNGGEGMGEGTGREMMPD